VNPSVKTPTGMTRAMQSKDKPLIQKLFLNKRTEPQKKLDAFGQAVVLKSYSLTDINPGKKHKKAFLGCFGPTTSLSPLIHIAIRPSPDTNAHCFGRLSPRRKKVFFWTPNWRATSPHTHCYRGASILVLTGV